ncbi:hypothetical protein BJ742DRAFT_852909 [Cladochytrium replicatum]|nr:hypothetical protein BJ742DRAFT_852909 [Cladochytrium replicatum]
MPPPKSTTLPRAAKTLSTSLTEPESDRFDDDDVVQQQQPPRLPRERHRTVSDVISRDNSKQKDPSRRSTWFRLRNQQDPIVPPLDDELNGADRPVSASHTIELSGEALAHFNALQKAQQDGSPPPIPSDGAPLTSPVTPVAAPSAESVASPEPASPSAAVPGQRHRTSSAKSKRSLFSSVFSNASTAANEEDMVVIGWEPTQPNDQNADPTVYPDPLPPQSASSSAASTLRNRHKSSGSVDISSPNMQPSSSYSSFAGMQSTEIGDSQITEDSFVRKQIQSKLYCPRNRSLLKKDQEIHKLFKSLPESEIWIEDYPCALQKNILIQGKLYLTPRHVCFKANIFGFLTVIVVPFLEITKIGKKATAVIIPNAIQIETEKTQLIFTSFLSRDQCFSYIEQLWRMNLDSDGIPPLPPSSAEFFSDATAADNYKEDDDLLDEDDEYDDEHDHDDDDYDEEDDLHGYEEDDEFYDADFVQPRWGTPPQRRDEVATREAGLAFSISPPKYNQPPSILVKPPKADYNDSDDLTTDPQDLKLLPRRPKRRVEPLDDPGSYSAPENVREANLVDRARGWIANTVNRQPNTTTASSSLQRPIQPVITPQRGPAPPASTRTSSNTPRSRASGGRSATVLPAEQQDRQIQLPKRSAPLIPALQKQNELMLVVLILCIALCVFMAAASTLVLWRVRGIVLKMERIWAFGRAAGVAAG